MNDDKDKNLNDILSEGSQSAEQDSLKAALRDLRQSKNKQSELLLAEIFMEDSNFEEDSLNQSLKILKIQWADKIRRRFILLTAAAAILLISFLIINLLDIIWDFFAQIFKKYSVLFQVSIDTNWDIFKVDFSSNWKSLQRIKYPIIFKIWF